jgi:hypothetical protein
VFAFVKGPLPSTNRLLTKVHTFNNHVLFDTHLGRVQGPRPTSKSLHFRSFKRPQHSELKRRSLFLQGPGI